MAKNTLAISKGSKAVKITKLDPTSEASAIEASAIEAIETAPVPAPAPVVKAVPDGYAVYMAKDPGGVVFATTQAVERAYCAALVCDSPLGRIVARWSKDYKGLVREARKINSRPEGNKAINPKWGTVGLSNPTVVDVVTGQVVENAVHTTRRREVDYYGIQGLVGPNAVARAAVKAERESAILAKQAEFAASREQGMQGPVQE